MCRKTISTPTESWPTAPPGVSPTRREVSKALIKWVAETPLYRVVFEPTGLYHRAVERALGIAGVPFVQGQSRVRARRFAEATGKLAKTDRLDAAILLRMGALLELEARPARSELLFELKELYVAREALVKDRTAAKNRGKALDALAAETSECSSASNRSIARSRRSKRPFSRLSKLNVKVSPIASPS